MTKNVNGAAASDDTFSFKRTANSFEIVICTLRYVYTHFAIAIRIQRFMWKFITLCTEVAGDIRKMWMGHELDCNGIEDRLCFAFIYISLTKWQIWVFQSAPPLSAIYQRLAIDKVNLMSLPLFQFVCDLWNRYHLHTSALARQFNSFYIQW